MESTRLLDPLSHLQFFTRCTICLDTLRVPRTLPCLHTFCTSCLESHVSVSAGAPAESQAQFPCPACREPIVLPPEGVQGFRRDFRVEQIREVMIRNLDPESAAADGDSDRIPCSICSSALHSSSLHCRQCRKWFCDACARLHNRISVFSEHQLEAGNPRQPLVDMTCNVHATDELDYMCEECVKLVCSTCVMTEHQNHVITDRCQGVKDMVLRLGFHHKALQIRRSQMVSVMNRINRQREQLQRQKTLVANEIKVKVKQIIDNTYQEQRRLTEELERLVGEEESRLSHNKRQLESIIETVDGATGEAGCALSTDGTGSASLIEEYRRLERRLTKLIDDSMIVDLKPRFFQPAFTPSRTRTNLGRISIQDVVLSSSMPDGVTDDHSPTTSLESDDEDSDRSGRRSGDASQWPAYGTMSVMVKVGRLGSAGGEFNSPRDVCFVGETGQVAVCDTNNERVQLFDARGLLVRVIGQGEVRPWGVAASASNELVVADNIDKCVKIYDVDGGLLSRMGSFLCPCSVAVMSCGRIVVTDFFSSSAYVLDKDGTIQRRVRYRTSADKHACGASRVAITSRDHIIISDVSNASLKAYSRRGRHLWTISECDKMMAPQGVCVSVDDVIFVGDSVRHALIRFSVKGQYLGEIQVADVGLKEPTSLDVFGDSRVVIGCMNANQIRVYEMAN